MSMIEKRIRELEEEFAKFEDGFSRYSYLVELAALLPPYPEEKRTEDRLVRGCQSHVWLAPFEADEKFFFAGDSDTLIIKGILLLLQDLLNGLPLVEVAAVEFDALSAAGLQSEFSDQRQKGIGEVVRTLRTAAGEMLGEKNDQT